MASTSPTPSDRSSCGAAASSDDQPCHENGQATDGEQEIPLVPGANLYVRNFSDHLTNDGLKTLFAPFGTITSAIVMTKNGASRGFGFVNFTKPEDATKALTEMNKKLIDQKPLYVSLAQKKEERREFLAQERERYHQYGGGVSPGTASQPSSRVSTPPRGSPQAREAVHKQIPNMYLGPAPQSSLPHQASLPHHASLPFQASLPRPGSLPNHASPLPYQASLPHQTSLHQAPLHQLQPQPQARLPAMAQAPPPPQQFGGMNKFMLLHPPAGQTVQTGYVFAPAPPLMPTAVQPMYAPGMAAHMHAPLFNPAPQTHHAGQSVSGLMHPHLQHAVAANPAPMAAVRPVHFNQNGHSFVLAQPFGSAGTFWH